MVKLTETKIKESALTLFIKKGYAGTSLTDIGKEVGIKKQSIYTHFKSKEDLFLQVMNQVIKEEIAFLNDYFTNQKHVSLHDILYHFIKKLKERFISDGEENIKFLLRMMFIPPNRIKETVISKALTYYDQLKNHIEHTFHLHKDVINVSVEAGKISFLNLFDGLLVELIYINIRNFEKRFQISWNIYWQGIKK